MLFKLKSVLYPTDATAINRRRYISRLFLAAAAYEHCVTIKHFGCILVPRAHDPSGQWQGSRALAGPDFLSIRGAFVSYSRPIRFDGKSLNRGLPVLDQARALDPCHRPEGSWALGTRMFRVIRLRRVNFKTFFFIISRGMSFWV